MKNSGIVVDSSAIVAMLMEEPEGVQFTAVLNAHQTNFCSTVTFVETVMVLSTRVPGLSPSRLAGILEVLAIDQIAVDISQSSLASTAFLRFGKGRHPARLNMGDCFSYALAKSLNAPLLFKGDDFSQTDIRSALPMGAQRP